MNLFEASKLCDTTLYLIASALSGYTPRKELIDGTLVGRAYSLAASNSVDVLVTESLERLGLASGEMIMKKNMAIRKILLLDTERAAIFSELDRLGIPYMELKGTILQNYYSSIGQRQMSDNDILIDDRYRRTLHDIMTARGYTVKSYNSGNHDVYMKPPVYNYEIHVALFSSYSYTDLAAYFSAPFDAATRREDGSSACVMSEDYFYLYIKSHEYKHHSHGGTGIRSLIDTYLYLKNREKLLNREYLSAEFEKLGISKYENDSRILAAKVFDVAFCESQLEAYARGEDEYRDGVTENERDMLLGYFFAGTYGTIDNNVNRALDKMQKEGKSTTSVKLRYLFRRIFQPMDYYKENYPFFYKYKILIPFLIIYRTGAMIFARPRTTLKKLKVVLSYKSKKDKKDS